MALLPHPPHTPLDRYSDKFAHMLAFAVLAALALAGWPRVRSWRLIVALSAFGALIEVLQAIPVLHRDSQASDWVADTLAIAAVLLPAWAIRKHRPLA
jgi:VanZ family protein